MFASGTAEEIGLLPYCDPETFENFNEIHDHTLRHENPNILILKGTTVDQILCATLQLIIDPLADVLMRNKAPVLEHWFSPYNDELDGSNAKPYLKLMEVISDWIHNRGNIERSDPPIASITDVFDKRSSLRGCSFIMTKNGRHGFMVGAAREGDSIFEATGSAYPIVLRQEDKQDESYVLVGCSIIDGLMEREASKMLKAGELKEETILLR